MNKQELIDKLASLVGSIEDFKGISTFHDGKYAGLEHALELIKQLDEPQKPVVPKFVADLVDWTVRGNCIPSDVIREFQTNTPDTVNLPETLELEKLGEYFEKAYCRYDFERACILGYEIEKEPLYYVRLPYEVWDEEAAELKTEYLYLHYEITSDETRIFPTKEPRKGFVAKLDELTIKSADEKYWPFAVPVEEVAEG